MSAKVWILVNLIFFWKFFHISAQYAPPYNDFSNYGRDVVETIQIGLFTDRNPFELGTVFDHAIEVANEDGTVQLTSLKEEVNYGDSLQAYGRLCRMLQMGVGGIFGPSSKHTAAHLMTVCDSKDIPYIYSHITDNLDGFNLYPHPLDIASALHSILVAFDWSRFIFLYESSEYLTTLNGLLNLFGNNAPIMTVLRYDVQMNGNFKPVLRRVRKSVDNHIVVMGSSDTIPEFLKQAQQIGIISEDYSFIIGNLDFHAFDLEEYKYSEANITSLRMFSPEQEPVRALMEKLGYNVLDDDVRNGSCPITMEMALMYDAVQLFAETTKHIAFRPIPLNCSERSDSVRDDGSTFRNYMHSINLEERTLTGPINFEGNVRKGYTFDVIELQPSGIVKVGSWDEANNFTVQRLAKTNSKTDNIDSSLANVTFVVLLSVSNKPYASIVENSKKLEGNSQYEGFAVDLIAELADKLGFNYTLMNGGIDYGSFNKTTNVTTGMLKEIVEGRAHLAISDITITSDRTEVIDFSIPFMNLGISILYLAPTKARPSLFTFMDPFSDSVWILVGFSFVLVSACCFVLGRLSPQEWDNPFPCVEEPTELQNQFTVGNAIWFTTGALLQQGCELELKAFSVRIVGSIWLFFTLIMVSSYTANLAAFLTIENPTNLIEDVNDLAENKGGIRYGAKKTGSTRNFFLTTEDPIYKKMNEYMTQHPEYLTNTNEEGVNEVLANEDYAFLMESTTIEYNTQRICNLKKIGDALDEKVYGIAMPKNWQYRPIFNNALIQLQEQGTLAKMKNKWWKEVGAGLCSSKGESSEASPLNMENLFGVYFVMIIGSLVALIYGIISWLWFVKKRAKHFQLPFKTVFIEEFKLVTDFHAHTRVLSDTNTSVYSRSRHSSASVDSLDADTNS